MDELKNAITQLGYQVGCITKHNYTKAEIKAIIESLTEEQTDVKVKNGYVEIVTVDDEKDILFVSLSDYQNRYGVDN